MSNRNSVLKEIHQIDDYMQRVTIMTSIHPCAKLLVTVCYLGILVSFPQYDLSGLLAMGIYLIVVYQLGDISIKKTAWGLKEIFLMLLLLGVANLFFDREVLAIWGGIEVTGGMLSFITLYLKGIFALLASYALIATTGIENICYALQVFRLPRIMITVILLIYRYLVMFLKEVERISLAYSMRAPGQKGIHRKAWGSLVGNMLIRSIDRSQTVYESMELRGFGGEFQLKKKENISSSRSFGYAFFASLFLLVFRIFPVFEWIGLLI